METRNVTLTLKKAKEFYNSGNAALKEVALQAFTKEELTTPNYTDIKTFKDACLALGMSTDIVEWNIEDACAAIGLPMYKANAYIKAILLKGEVGISQHLVAIYKLDIIRKALNGDWKPKMAEGSIYYPWVRIYSSDKEAKKVAATNNVMLGPTLIADNKRYTLVGGEYSYHYAGGLTHFDSRLGIVYPDLGLLGCKSKEIASHMSRYFVKEIFEANYAQHIGAYEWIDEV